VVDALAGLAEDLRSEGDLVARFHDAVKKMKQERDEARAEVERLKKAVHTRACQTQSVYSVQCVCGADEHQRDLRTLAYKRGAEAMREAAAVCIKHASHEDGLGMGSQRMEAAIRTLPIPEDKP
jgi:hypothetical protein